MKKQTGEMPLFGRTPKHAEWRLLEAAAIDMKDYIDHNDLKVILDIAQKRDIERYSELSSYWDLTSVDPRINLVGTRDACLYQLSSLLIKMSWDDSISPHQIDAANRKFFEYEQRMRVYNRISHSELRYGKDPLVPVWLTRMRHFISSVLGPLDLKSVQRYSDHGPGGTYGMSSQSGHRFYKNATIPYEVTSSSIHMARRLIRDDERWKQSVVNKLVVKKLIWTTVLPLPLLLNPFKPDCFRRLKLPCNSELFRVVPGNRIEYVPKKESEARTIALEATMNVMLQLGVDGHIRKRLKKFNIDINRQDINQKLARVGSIDNSLSTLDLKGASDNISLAVVELLFPYEWIEYLYLLRSDIGIMPDGTTVRYEKLSSMGNGYTFAVETLIFAACVFAVNPEVKFSEDAHVYGDDIIIPSTNVPELTRLLGLCGFLINTEKSFTEPTFTRESCGADFIHGQNVRPVFLKNTLQSLDAFAFYSFHNRLLEWFSRILFIEQPKCATMLKAWCAPKWALYGPPDIENQSSYIAVPEPLYGRTSTGLFIHDQCVSKVKIFPFAMHDYDFAKLNHTLRSAPVNQYGVTENGGSRFQITKRGWYKIRAKKRSGRAYAWPRQYYSL